MNKLLLIIALFIGMTACGSKHKGSPRTEPESAGNDRTEVLYFHSKKRCATCLAIEEHTRDVVSTMFADELKNGAVVFRVIDMTTPEGDKMADRYEVAWSSLFVNKWKDGQETRSNLTEFGFSTARKEPELFKKELADKIRQ